jgi:hypothetical protein
MPYVGSLVTCSVPAVAKSSPVYLSWKLFFSGICLARGENERLSTSFPIHGSALCTLDILKRHCVLRHFTFSSLLPTILWVRILIIKYFCGQLKICNVIWTRNSNNYLAVSRRNQNYIFKWCICFQTRIL